MSTCKNCFVKYDSKGIREGLFSIYPNFEFCSSVCASAKREADEQRRNSEERAAESYEHQQREQARTRNYQFNDNRVVRREDLDHHRKMEESQLLTLKFKRLLILKESIISKKSNTTEETKWLEKSEFSVNIFDALIQDKNNITALIVIADALISAFPNSNSNYPIESVIPKSRKDIFDDF